MNRLATALVALLLIGLVGGLAAAGAYQQGFAQGAASAVAAGAADGGAVVAPPLAYAYGHWGWGGGPGIFGGFLGFLLTLLLIGFVLRLVFGGRGRRGWGPGGPGVGGPGWGGHSADREAWIADIHRRLHERESGSEPDPSAR